MSRYDDVTEAARQQADRAVGRAAEERGGGAKPSSPADRNALYITFLSLTVAVVALLAAFAADRTTADQIERVVGEVRLSQLEIAELHAQVLAGEGTTASLSARAAQAGLAGRIAAERRRLAEDEATLGVLDRAHYVFAVAITLFQLATALAALQAVARNPLLALASLALAVLGVGLTLVAVVKLAG